MSKSDLRIPPEAKTLGEAIRWAREQRGITLRELARRIDVSAPFVCDLEKDRRTSARLTEIAKALGVDVVDLETRKGVTREMAEWLRNQPGLLRVLRRRMARGAK